MASSRVPDGHFTLLYFASAASFTRKPHDHIAGPMKLRELFDHLEAKYPGIKSKVLESSAVTINLDYVDLDEDTSNGSLAIIKSGDEVAIIPPVSSG